MSKSRILHLDYYLQCCLSVCLFIYSSVIGCQLFIREIAEDALARVEEEHLNAAYTRRRLLAVTNDEVIKLVNARNHQLRTPMHYAAANGQVILSVWNRCHSHL